jgi:hypothetical protein
MVREGEPGFSATSVRVDQRLVGSGLSQWAETACQPPGPVEVHGQAGRVGCAATDL